MIKIMKNKETHLIIKYYPNKCFLKKNLFKVLLMKNSCFTIYKINLSDNFSTRINKNL